MIQANELRIGNYTINSIDGIVVISCISKKNNTATIYKDNNSYTYRDCSLSNLNPIPLTEEILLKCGFESKYRDEEDNEIFNIDSFYITKHLFYNEFWIDANIVTPDRIKYLHQLQNLYFSLTGKELEVNL